ncbi:MAG: hypothetical protein LBI38_06835 [Oscillospiraceae bacterium]|jgi:Flp pilus assembly protein TadB|nr:hypothetical protein [Oscillospiraceae bacterium]
MKVKEGREYDGKKVEWGRIKYDNTDEERVSAKLAEKIRKAGSRRELTESEVFRLKNKFRSKGAAKKESRGFYAACAVMFAAFFLVPHFIPGLPLYAAVMLNALVAAFAAVFVLEGKTGKKAAKKRAALEKRKYEAYDFEIIHKIWSRREEESGSFDEFYLQCAKLTLCVQKRVYKAVGGGITVVLFPFGKGAALEVLAPDRSGRAPS